MLAAEARVTMTEAGYLLSDRPSKYFDNEIVVRWPDLGAVGVLCVRNGIVDCGEVETFVANAERVREAKL